MTQLKGFTEAELIESHHFQYDGSHKNPNECTLCSMTMLLEMGAKFAGSKLDLKAVELGKELDRIPFRYPRFPAWLPGPGGATHPFAAYWSLKRKVKNLRETGLSFPWKVRLQFRQGPEELEKQFNRGNPTLIYGVGKTGIPHVVVPIAHENGNWKILDPGFARQRNPREWGEKQLLVWWRNYGWIYPRGTMISLETES